MELYPSRYEEWVDLRNGRKVFLRPVKEMDGPLLVELFGEMSLSSVRLRFLSPLHQLPEQLVYRFTHVDYRKDFGLAALIDENSGPIIGVARYAYDPRARCQNWQLPSETTGRETALEPSWSLRL